MRISAKGKVYLVYCPSLVAWESLRSGGLFRVEWLTIFVDKLNAELESLHNLVVGALERGDLIFCEHTSGSHDGDEINPKVIMATLSKLLQVEIPPHESVINPDGLSHDLALQPLQKGEVLLLFNPYYNADDCEGSMVSVPTAILAGKLQENEPPPLARPAKISMFDVMAILCCETN